MSLCSVSKGTGMNIFAAMFLDRVKDFINFKLECPLKQVRLAQISSFNPLNFYSQGLHEFKSFKKSKGLDLLMTILPLYKAQSLVVQMSNKFGRTMENVYTFSINFEVVEVD